jgi:hypothetical protein
MEETIMSAEKLAAALKAVNWVGHVDSFLIQNDSVQKVDGACARIAIWAKQLENLDKENAAISFIRALQISAHHAVATTALAIYKAAASSIRGIVENALYYTYFRSHPVELASLVRERDYYVSKSDILSYHKIHTPRFRELQDKLGLITRIEEWYSQISAIVHGQVPGIWVEHTSLADTKPSTETLALVIAKLCEAEKIVHDLFLITVGREYWDSFSHFAKKTLLANMSGEHKTLLMLDKS